MAVAPFSCCRLDLVEFPGPKTDRHHRFWTRRYKGGFARKSSKSGAKSSWQHENEATTTRPGEAFRGQQIPHWHGRAFVSSDVGPLCVFGAQDPPCEAWRSMVTPTDQARSREGREGRGDGRRGLAPASGGALRACRMPPPGRPGSPRVPRDPAGGSLGTPQAARRVSVRPSQPAATGPEGTRRRATGEHSANHPRYALASPRALRGAL